MGDSVQISENQNANCIHRKGQVQEVSVGNRALLAVGHIIHSGMYYTLAESKSTFCPCPKIL